MKGFKIRFLLLQMLLMVTSVTFGQVSAEMGKVNIASPNAAALGKYADIPVNKNTGIPEIVIPLYTIDAGPLKLPISLSYHAGGVKVQEVASSSGIGFSLLAGGAITRTVRGLPDDRSGSLVQTKAHYVDYGYSNYFYNRGDSVISDTDFANGVLDGEPDLFFFNFNGYSGKFYFNDDRTPVLVPEQDLKIEVGIIENVRQIEGFTITTPDGTKYFFGKNGNTSTVVPVETTSVYSSRYGRISGAPISSWFLNKIQSADNQFSISFTYEQERYSYYTMSPQEISGQYKEIFPLDQRDAYLVKNSVEGVRLSKITFPNGNIDFIAGQDPRQDLARYDINDVFEHTNVDAKPLKEIQIKSDGNSFCKKFIFYHDYFRAHSFPPEVALRIGVNTISDLKRLKLDSLEEISCNAIERVGKYKFNYFGETVSSTLSFAQDYWGFFNGMTNNKTIIPDIRENGNLVKGADRKPYWPSMRAGSLQRITYPTGGSTNFEFEPHSTYANYTDYTTTWESIHLGGDGNISRSVPETLVFVTDGSGILLDVNNQSPINDGYVSIYDPQGIRAGFGLNVYKGQTRKEAVSLAAGTYHVKLGFTNAGGNPSGYPLVASIGKNISFGVNEDVTVGGLRIKNITDKVSATGQAIVTAYSYARQDGNSSGELYNRPTFAMVKRNDLYKLVKDDGPFQAKYNPPFCNTNGCANCELYSLSMAYVKSGGDLRPMASVQGQHIGYTQVKVSQAGNGYSLYRFFWSKFLQYPYLQGPPGAVANIFVNTLTCDPNSPNYPTTPLPFEYQKGLPQFVGHFDNTGGLLKSTEYNYIFKENPLFTPAYIVVQDNMLWGSFYNLRTARKVEEQMIETNYSAQGNDTLYTTKYYNSRFHNQITEELILGSNRDTLRKKYDYAFDYQVPAALSIGDGLLGYHAADSTALAAFDQAIMQAELYQTGNRWIALQRYKRAKVNARINFINYRRTNFSGISNSWQTARNTAKSSAGVIWKPILQLQDNYQNLPVEMHEWRKGKTQNTTFINYAISGTTSAVYPSYSEVIDFNRVAPILVPAKVVGNNIVKDSRYRLEHTVKYGSGNLVETTLKKELPTSYLWGYGNQYPIAVIKNASYADVLTAIGGQAVINQLNNPAVSEDFVEQRLRALRTALPAAHVTSFTYRPLVGMSSETDAKGLTTYYLYDGLQRLQDVLDLDKNILQRFQYYYKGQRNVTTSYSNTLRSQNFTRNNCPAGRQGSLVQYTVPAGRYTSTISQAAADQLAQHDVNANGQAYANQQGVCTVVSNCRQFRVTIPSHVLQTNGGNLYVSYPTCAGGQSGVISIHNLPAELSDDCMDCHVLSVCVNGLSHNIAFYFQQFGGAVYIDGIQIEQVGSCN